MNNYKEKYNQALRKALDLYNQGLINPPLEYIFPELKESKDERIRKELIAFIKKRDRSGCDYDYDKWIAWLEKQGKQQTKSIIKDVKEEKVDNTKGFRVGQWIINNKSKEAFLIKSFNSGYCTLEDIKGNIFSPCELPFEDQNHLWTIKDAKNGDVLVDEYNNIGLYLEEKDDLYWHSCIYLGCDNYLRSVGGYHKHKNTKPATKEQRDLFFSEMKQEGYEWNSEKN